MSTVRAESVAKRFGATVALAGLDLEVRSGEFFTLLGPSGCGKTTLLRILAGLEEPCQGKIFFGERRVDRLPVHQRNVGMVFQNYALFPHLSVGENVAYGLKARGMPPREAEGRAAEALEMVGLGDCARRFPEQLSGGQQQRVSLARALVTRPSVLLMDEPLSNLDARLRIQMRTEVRRLVKEAGICTIYVTHDQEEALAISDRIGVMAAGRLIQVGSPLEIYHRPASREVAAFVGHCAFLPGTVQDGVLSVAGQRLSVSAAYARAVAVGIRPEAVVLGGAGGLVLDGEVVEESFLGPVTQVAVRVGGGGLILVNSTRPPGSYQLGDRVRPAVDPAALLLFAADTGEAVP